MDFFNEKLLKVAGPHFSPGGDNGRLTILMYHRVLPTHDPMTPDVTDAATFERHMSAISKVFNVLRLDESIDQLYGGRLRPMSLAITFDDGHTDNLEIATPILKKYGLHATFFLSTGFMDGTLMYNDLVTEAVRRAPSGQLKLDWLGLKDAHISDAASRQAVIGAVVQTIKYFDSLKRAEVCNRLESIAAEPLPTNLMMNYDQIVRLHREGMGIGAHTKSHPILTRVTDEEALNQMLQNKNDLTSITGTAPRLFAYPNGKPVVDFNARHIEMVRQAGFDAALTTSFGAVTKAVDRFQIPRHCPWDKNENMLIFRILRMARAGMKIHGESVKY